jgi:hypothetical protein
MSGAWRRNLFLAAVLLAAWAGWYGWQSWKLERDLNRLADVVRSKELDTLLTDPPEEIRSNVDLAVRGVSLSHGKDGRKTFELKADWATLDQKTNDVTVRDPDAVYVLDPSKSGGGERRVHATSKIGRVENGNARVSMSGDVKAVSEANTLFSSEAVYVNDLRVLEFPSGARLKGEDIEGESGHLAWDLNDNTITGSRGVKVRWFPSRGDAPAQDPPAGQGSAGGAPSAREDMP